jgi:hypothetical protein
MRRQKIRGNRRRYQHIEQWRLKNLKLRLDLLEKYSHEYIGIMMHPWCDISIRNSKIPEPKGKIKQLMLSGLIDIYYSWKEQLEKVGQPYYLKIWLFEPRFSKSQVVCAVGEEKNFYDNTFFKPDQNKVFPLKNYGMLHTELKKIDWEYRLDEDYYDNCYVDEPHVYSLRQDYEEDKRWFEKLMKKPHRTAKLKEPIGDIIESYSFKIGDLWLGGQQ